METFGWVGFGWVGWIGFYDISTIDGLFNAKSSLYIYIKYMWFRLIRFYGILTLIGYLMPNPLNIYIKYIRFGLVGFYDISTLIGYLMPNPLYTYILNIYDLETHFIDNIFKWAWDFFKFFFFFFCSQLNGFKYFYLLPIICQHTAKWLLYMLWCLGVKMRTHRQQKLVETNILQ